MRNAGPQKTRLTRREWLRYLAGSTMGLFLPRWLRAAPAAISQNSRRGAGATLPTQPTRPNILLISVDTLRADHTGLLGYARRTTPCIDRLASEGVCFTRAYAASAWTGSSHATALSGFYPPVHQLDNVEDRLPEHFPTLAQALHDLNYYTKAIISGPMVEASMGFAQGFDSFDNNTYKAATDFKALRKQVNYPNITEEEAREEILLYKTQTAEAVREAAEKFLASPPRQPWFLFLHFWDVHADYRPPEAYDIFDPDYDGSIDGNLKSDAVNPNMAPRDLRHLMALYDGEIRWTDHQVGMTLQKLKDLHLDGQTCVALFSDHGEEFFEYGNKGHGNSLHDLLVHVPLMFRWPGKIAPGRRSDAPVSLVDLTPALIEIAGGQPSPLLQGRSVLPLLRDPHAAPEDKMLFGSLFFRGQSQLYKLEYPLKLIQAAQTGELYLYNLALDPAEQKNLSPDMPDLARQHAADLQSWWNECTALRGKLPGVQWPKKSEKGSGNAKQNS